MRNTLVYLLWWEDKKKTSILVCSRLCLEKVERLEEEGLVESTREVLIKSILQAIQTYIMGCFELPQSLNREIKRLTAKFYWVVMLKG